MIHKKCLSIVIFFLFVAVSYCQEINITKLEEKTNNLTFLRGETSPFTGKCIGYFDNDQIAVKGQYLNGKKNGKWTWWYSDGKIKRESLYENGKKSGNTTYWYKNGQKMSEVFYHDDKMINSATWWYENGQKKKMNYYDDGKFLWGKKWDENGKLDMDQNLK